MRRRLLPWAVPVLAIAVPHMAAAQAAAQSKASDAAPNASWTEALGRRIDARLAGDTALVAVALSDPVTGGTLLRDADRRVHAASTMKVPVLIELARQIDRGHASWDDPLTVHNGFASIVDGSPYVLDPSDDSDTTLYALEGKPVARRRLAELMIERSSNLATNLLIATLDPRRVQATARALGADSMEIRRGVEDGKAYAAGLNNTTTARDLAALFGAIARGEAASPAGTAEILRVLFAQEFNERIPAGLPPGTRVAHKTGEITGIAHDAALIFPPSGPPNGSSGDSPGGSVAGAPYVLVVLTRGYADPAVASRAIADVSRLAWDAVLAARRARGGR